MKKNVVVFLLCVFTIGVSFSQEKNVKFHGSISVGSANFYSYSGVSTFDYHLDNFKSGLYAVELGAFLSKGFAVDLGMNVIGSNFQYENGIKENNGLVYINFCPKEVFSVTDKLSLIGDVGVGILSSTSQLYLNNNKYTVNRNGSAVNFDFAISYKVYKDTFFSAKVGAMAGSLDAPDLPDALKPYKSEHQNNIFSTNMAISFNIML